MDCSGTRRNEDEQRHSGRHAGHRKRPDPERSSPTVLIVNGSPYLIDFGPGVIRRAVAPYNKGVTAIGPAALNLRTAFLTHFGISRPNPDPMDSWPEGIGHGLWP